MYTKNIKPSYMWFLIWNSFLKCIIKISKLVFCFPKHYPKYPLLRIMLFLLSTLECRQVITGQPVWHNPVWTTLTLVETAIAYRIDLGLFSHVFIKRIPNVLSLLYIVFTCYNLPNRNKILSRRPVYSDTESYYIHNRLFLKKNLIFNNSIMVLVVACWIHHYHDAYVIDIRHILY